MKNKTDVFALGDVCDLIGGGTPSKSNKSYYNGTIPWATVRDMSGDVITETEHHITIRAVEESSTNILPGGSVVIATRVGLGKVCMLERDTAINQDLKGVIPKRESEVDSRYLFWWLKSVADKIVAAGRGATVQGVKLDFVRSLQIPVPPLSEQRRIVALLDEAFSAIDQAIENTKKNMENAKELFDSYLTEVFTKKGEEWVEKRLGDVVTLRRGFDLPRKSRIKGPYDLVSSSGVIDTHNEGPIRGPGIATGRSGSIGKVHFIEGDYWPLNTVLYAEDMHGNAPRFILWLLRAFPLERYASGSGVPTLNRNHVHEERVSVPEDTSVQLRVAEKLDHLDREKDVLKAALSNRLDLLAELKRSVLVSAISGRTLTVV